ncbi:hypothetical protein KPL71_000880 [Citrus sinensis]|uniref:Uncharacterized protein n=1 Tax=Citrus sinensis TaxID=2711 RepID=A0ACB8NSE1_CITSI|nr:hypothetical protein KPL71_000880 [Citrus sinensis]
MESCSSKQIFQQLNSKKIDSNEDSTFSIDSSLEEDSTNSVSSSMSSSELVEDASSSTSSSCSPSSSSSNGGPLYEFSELMAQLPINVIIFCGCRRGLSKFYQGKSQSFTSLASVKNIEDLAKMNIKGSHYYRMKMKSCKSYGGGLDIGHSKSYSPKAKATISKKSSIARGSFLSSLAKSTNQVV